MSVQPAESVVDYRRDRENPTCTDYGCHRGAGALARSREALHRPHQEEEVKVRQLHRGVLRPTGKGSNPHYPFSQPSLLYPRRPQPASQHRNVTGKRGPLSVGERRREEEAEKAFRDERLCEGGPGTRQVPKRCLEPLRALLPREASVMEVLEDEKAALKQLLRDREIKYGKIEQDKKDRIEAGKDYQQRRDKTKGTNTGEDEAEKEERTYASVSSSTNYPLSTSAGGLITPSPSASYREMFKKMTVRGGEDEAEKEEEEVCEAAATTAAAPESYRAPVTMGLQQLRAEEEERRRPKTQAEIGSPLDYPDMPAKMVYDDSYLKPNKSMHHRMFYYDASLWNPFRTPRLADEWGGVHFAFRFLQHPELHPRVGGTLGGERELKTGAGGRPGRHDPMVRVGYTLYGPTHASYCPENQVTPLVEKCHRRLEKLEEPERLAAEEAEKWRLVAEKARERKPYYPKEDAAHAGQREAMSGADALNALLAHNEEDEFLTEEEKVAKQQARNDLFYKVSFPDSSVKVNRERLETKVAKQKARMRHWGEELDYFKDTKLRRELAERKERDRQRALLREEEREEVRREEAAAAAALLAAEQQERRQTEEEKEDLFLNASPHKHDGFSSAPFFLHTDTVNLRRLREKRVSQKALALQGYPQRRHPRVDALDPMRALKTKEQLLAERRTRLATLEEVRRRKVDKMEAEEAALLF